MSPGSRRAALLVALCSSFAFAQANAGVSDERVTLPQTSGSIAGVGENASTSGNQGALSYSVNVEVPAGFPGLTPQISFTYSSSGGAGVLGMGWAMPGYSIDRMTSKGLQKYDLNDRFVVDGSEELVKVADSGSSATYRARFEGGFVRYTWLARGTGDGGSWKAEFPDGRVGYYGADKAGLAVPSAQVRVPASTNTFSWHLVLMEDPWGHQERFTWTKDASGYPLLERIEYLFEGTLPRHSVRFTYEPRPDVLSDAKPGFDLRLTQRLKDVRVFSGTTAAEQIRRYALEYETVAISGGGTRLAAVSRFGRGELAYPVKFSFAYSKTLGGTCSTNCDKPFVVSMGSLGVNFSTGRASLVDINGDAIPDVLFSDAQNRHQFFYGKLDTEGHASFATTPRQSAQTTTSFVLGDARTQLLDVNGDGFVDITQAKLPAVLCNDGSGDWVAASFCTGTPPGLPGSYTPEEDPVDTVQQDPRYVRFFDYDNDKRIDWLRTLAGSTSTEVLANTDAGFVAVTVDNIGAAFDESPLQLADMNGDGLQDPVQLVVSGAVVTVQYKLNLGFGKWSPTWTSIAISGLTASQASVAELQDINGDSLADVVAVTGNEVALVLNRNGDSFAPVLTVTSADLGMGAIPQRLADTTVSFADMNGNGSDDIVWFQAGGAIAYLELFPVRPNLVSRIDNGLGAVQLISYGTSIAEQARDAAAGNPWPHRVPNATVLVTRVDSFVTLTGSDTGGLRETVAYRYHSGFYDGVEKQFRGYEGVEQQLLSNLATDAQEPGVVVLDFDVGAANPAFAGRERKRAVYSLATSTPALISEQRSLDELCPVADTAPEVAFVCERASTTVLAERDLANARTLQVQRDYDGYGNITREAKLGVVNLGTPESPRACEACLASGLFGRPCGAQCEGDEEYTQTQYISPGTATAGAWMLGRESQLNSGAAAGNLQLESRMFYDGPDFVGLAQGQLTRGGVTRVSHRVGTGAADFIDASRFKRDASGNPQVSIAPNGTVAGSLDRRLYTYDAAGLHATQVELVLDAHRSLRRDSQHEPLFESMSQASNWYPVLDGQPGATPQQTRYRYDEHGRTSRVLDPGDADASASTEYQYELADPVSRVLTLKRSSAAGAQDLVTATCFDGRGRVVQTRQQLSPSSWQVSGFTEFDSRGAEVRTFQPWLASSGACEAAAPQSVPFVRSTFDVLHRALSEVEPDGSLRRHEYAPLVHRTFDEDDNDPSSPSANTPLLEETDGLGRLVSIARTSSGGVPGVVRLEYDDHGSLSAVKDSAGSAHLQRFDLMGRLTEVTDVNSGLTRNEYDAAGNVVRRTDARATVVRSQYDALDRLVAQWDESDEAGTKVTWTYDATSGCSECTNAGGKVSQIDWTSGGAPAHDQFGYDAKGNLVFRERLVDGQPLVVRYRYDAADRQVAELYPAGLTVERKYDGASRLSAMPGYVDTLEYTERGQLGALHFSNGVKTSWEYDSRLRPSRLATMAADASALFDLGFARTKRGDLTSVTDAATRAPRARHGALFGYDSWNRVTSATLDRAEGAAEVLSLTYDERDDVLSLASSLGASSRAHVGDYSYDPTKVNAVSKAGATEYTWDAAGHLSTRGDNAYRYDHLGRLTSASGGTFLFGPGSRRVVKQEGDFTTRFDSDAFEVRDGIAVVYARVGSSRVARVESDALASTLLSDLAPNQTIDIADAWLAQGAAVGVVQLAGGSAPSPVKALLASAARRLLMQDIVWLHEDHLQSVVASTTADGAVQAEQSFYPAGELRSSTGYVDDYGFTGQARDVSTGLIHFQFRELDPLSGRWASVDPKFSQLTPDLVRLPGQSTTGYAYVANNFANDVDPTGLSGKGSSGDGSSKKGAPPKAVKKVVVIKKKAGPGTTANAEQQGRIAAGIARPSLMQGAAIANLQQPALMPNVVLGAREQASLAEFVRNTRPPGASAPAERPYNVVLPPTGQQSNYTFTPSESAPSRPAAAPGSSGDYAFSPGGRSGSTGEYAFSPANASSDYAFSPDPRK